jgi:hypothetical protein
VTIALGVLAVDEETLRHHEMEYRNEWTEGVVILLPKLIGSFLVSAWPTVGRTNVKASKA